MCRLGGFRGCRILNGKCFHMVHNVYVLTYLMYRSLLQKRPTKETCVRFDCVRFDVSYVPL